MAFLTKFDAFNRKFSSIIEWIGLIAFFLMMALTTIDVIGAKVFLLPVPGSLDIMMLAQLIAMSFAIAMTQIFDRHIQVEFFVPLFPKLIQNLCDVIYNLLCFILFFLISWRLIAYGIELNTTGEVSPTIRLPMAPFAIGAGIASIPVCLIYLSTTLKSILKVFKK